MVESDGTWKRRRSLRRANRIRACSLLKDELPDPECMSIFIYFHYWCQWAKNAAWIQNICIIPLNFDCFMSTGCQKMKSSERLQKNCCRNNLFSYFLLAVLWFIDTNSCVYYHVTTSTISYVTIVIWQHFLNTLYLLCGCFRDLWEFTLRRRKQTFSINCIVARMIIRVKAAIIYFQLIN